MYPLMIDDAEQENNQRALTLSTWRMKSSRCTSRNSSRAQAVKEGKAVKDEPYYVCQVCGNTVAGSAPERCPVCGSPASKFKKVD